MNLSPRIALPALGAGAFLILIAAFTQQHLQPGVSWALGCTGILVLASAGAGVGTYLDHSTHRSPVISPAKAAAGQTAPAAASLARPDLFAGLTPNTPQRTETLVDIDTGELVGDRVLLLEERIGVIARDLVDLSQVVQDQAQLTAKAFGTLRREVERISHVFAEPEGAS